MEPPRPQPTFTARSTSVALLLLASCSTIPPEEQLQQNWGAYHGGSTNQPPGSSPSLHQGQEWKTKNLQKNKSTTPQWRHLFATSGTSGSLRTARTGPA